MISIAVYNIFLPGYLSPTALNPASITGGARLTTEPPVQGTLFCGVNGASVAAAAAALQAALPTGNQQGLMHVYLQSNDNTA